MNMQIALRDRSRASWSFAHPGLWWAGIIVLSLLALSLLMSPATERASGSSQIQPVIHFQDASHNLLMVVDPATHELVVYDANDGRPLHRLGADDGLSDVAAISREGSLLLVSGTGRNDIRVLQLPQLQAVALNER